MLSRGKPTNKKNDTSCIKDVQGEKVSCRSPSSRSRTSSRRPQASKRFTRSDDDSYRRCLEGLLITSVIEGMISQCSCGFGATKALFIRYDTNLSRWPRRFLSFAELKAKMLLGGRPVEQVPIVSYNRIDATKTRIH